MFYIWFTYLKKYGGLSKDDTVAIIVDELSFAYMNEVNYFGYIASNIPFNIEVSTYRPPSNLLEGICERYNYCHFRKFTKNSLNMYLDIDCLTIRKISTLFNDYDDGSLFVTPEGRMSHNNYGGFFLSDDADASNLPGFSAGWLAWHHSDAIQIFFKDVLKGVAAESDTPLYTLDQPFYNYELYLLLTGKKTGPKLCIMDSKIISINPLFSDPSLADAFFVNFCGEPGVEDCHFFKMLSFMCVNFSN